MRNQAPPDAYIEDQHEEHDPDDYGPNSDDPEIQACPAKLQRSRDNATNETGCAHCGSTYFIEGEKYNICMDCGRVNDNPKYNP